MTEAAGGRPWLNADDCSVKSKLAPDCGYRVEPIPKREELTTEQVPGPQCIWGNPAVWQDLAGGPEEHEKVWLRQHLFPHRICGDLGL